MEGDMTKIKICGITREEEISWLNEAGVDYAGFVLYEKSKRYISVDEAERMARKLNPYIKKVAVTVSPERELVSQIEQAGFDILQVHGEFEWDMIGDTCLSLWRAVNLSGMEELRRWRIPPEDRIDGILFDAGDFGSGRTFGWDSQGGAHLPECGRESEKESGNSIWKQEFLRFRAALEEQKKQFILAGGLHPGNVAEGIALFAPDVVDVSSGVEVPGAGAGTRRGKSREKIEAFVQAARSCETLLQ